MCAPFSKRKIIIRISKFFHAFFQRLLDEFRRDPTVFLWIDDVFVTGILAKRAGVKHESLVSAYALDTPALKKAAVMKKLIFAHVPGRKNHDMREELWGKIMKKNKLKYEGKRLVKIEGRAEEKTAVEEEEEEVESKAEKRKRKFEERKKYREEQRKKKKEATEKM